MSTGQFVTVVGRPTAARALRAWQQVFPAPGRYYVERIHPPEQITKAPPPEGEHTDPFETWFLDQLSEAARHGITTSTEAIWWVLERLLRSRGVEAPSELDWWELQRILFDLGNASTAHMVGLRIPQQLQDRLSALGWRRPEIGDFPGLAFRMGLIYRRLEARTPTTFAAVKRLAEQIPLTTAERKALEHVRKRAGIYLRPIYDEAGRVWTAEREIGELRRVARTAVAKRIPVREAARMLSNSQRARGIFRDAERVMRTEIAEARAQGAWMRDQHQPQAMIYRHTSLTPCRVCLRLYKAPDGMPRLWPAAVVEQESASGPNHGPQDTWGPRIGPTHPNCVCSPWSQWIPELESVFRPRAGYFAELMRKLGIVTAEPHTEGAGGSGRTGGRRVGG